MCFPLVTTPVLARPTDAATPALLETVNQLTKPNKSQRKCHVMLVAELFMRQNKSSGDSARELRLVVILAWHDHDPLDQFRRKD